jgi:hypothetical protein
MCSLKGRIVAWLLKLGRLCYTSCLCIDQEKFFDSIF